jgi:hypothetical protein
VTHTPTATQQHEVQQAIIDLERRAIQSAKRNPNLTTTAYGPVFIAASFPDA